MKRYAFATVLGAVGLLFSTALMGCGPEPLDTSKGSFGKTDSTNTLPKQPDPQEIAKSRAANPSAGGVPGATPAK